MADQSLRLLSTLKAHLRQVEDDPSRPLDVKLLEECIVFLPQDLVDDASENSQLVSQISTLSSQLQQDPTYLIRLLQELVEPFTFADVLSLQPQVDFVGG